jgi:hypothetical protein
MAQDAINSLRGKRPSAQMKTEEESFDQVMQDDRP